MKRTLLLMLALVLLLVLPLASQEKPRDGVFIHLSSNDPHRVVMALTMAERMMNDRDVLVYCDIKGIEAVLKDGKDIEFHTMGSSHALLKKLVDKHVTIFACPGCLKAAGKTADDLMPGVAAAEKDVFFSFTRGRILTLDY